MAGLSVAVGKDEHVGELVFVARDRTEGSIAAEGLGEGDPFLVDLGVGFLGLAGGGLGGGLQSSAEVKAEATTDGRWSSSQGPACG